MRSNSNIGSWRDRALWNLIALDIAVVKKNLMDANLKFQSEK